jgi:inner membrane protein
MIAVTHGAFATAIGALCGVSKLSVGLMVVGSLLPDLDHPQSTVGRILFFISIPLNKKLGHRRAFHGYSLWGLVALVGLVWNPLLWIGLGALSHVYLDSYNVMGVQSLMPFSEKVLVLFDRKYRIVSGSRKELVFLVIFIVLAWGGGYIGSIGGIRSVLASAMGSYQMAYDQYLKEGTHICYMDGELRHGNGQIEEGRWLVIGKEGDQDGIAIWNEKDRRIIHTPNEAEFLSVKLKATEEEWETLKASGWVRIKSLSYFYDGKKWKYAEPGDTVFGYILTKDLVIEAAGEW